MWDRKVRKSRIKKEKKKNKKKAEQKEGKIYMKTQNFTFP